ncbi:MAG: hypothetical protein EZS28_038444, partial [Streblomastix strix]
TQIDPVDPELIIQLPSFENRIEVIDPKCGFENDCDFKSNSDFEFIPVLCPEQTAPAYSLIILPYQFEVIFGGQQAKESGISVELTISAIYGHPPKANAYNFLLQTPSFESKLIRPKSQTLTVPSELQVANSDE